MTDTAGLPDSYRFHKDYGKLGLGTTLTFAGMIAGLLFVTFYFYFAVAYNEASLIPGTHSDWSGFFAALVPNVEALMVFGSWFILQAILYYIAPGTTAEGVELDRGGRLSYPINGQSSMYISFAIVAALHFSGIYQLHRLIDNFGALLSTITLYSFAQSTWLYFYGRKVDPHDMTGNFMRDFWVGTGKNPRTPDTSTGFDWKYFCEARPGLVGWMVINFALMSVQYEKYGFVSVPMMLVVGMQLLYIAHHFYNERFILTTMDIKHENFGMMLTFGDLAWVPFLYCLQAYYLVDHVHEFPAWAAVLVVLLNLFGFYLFKATNDQKDRFRRDPENAKIWGKPVEYMETSAGSRLILSGWWGKARHLNYTGDWIMAVAWSLPCLFDSIVPWFYPIYFGILLIHRDMRDNEMCHAKYGKDWETYCAKVKYRLLPGIY